MPDDGPTPRLAHSRHPGLPVAIIGAGPVGLAAAAELLARGQTPLLLEQDPQPGASVRAWGHVRMFSPWRFNTNRAAAALLAAHGWVAPDPEAYPTGAELVERYLTPLAAIPSIARSLRCNARVIAVTRRDHDRMRDGDRADAPFILQIAASDGTVEEIEAAAVLDCSGTWTSPNPAGAHGLKLPGEAALGERLAYGIPDVCGTAPAEFAGRTTLVIGSGHSAMNAVLDLAALAETAPGTHVIWGFRRPLAEISFGGGAADGLAERGALGSQARDLIAAGTVAVRAPLRIARLEPVEGRVRIIAQDGTAEEVDRIIVATGFRPDVSMLGELRLALDPAVQSPTILAPLIDPNIHSCGTVRPHGEAELRHSEPGFWIAGMKSYGRAPTFLMATGYEQVRSIAAALAGDWVAARRVELELPETGVCLGGAEASAQECCTPTTPQGVCCAPKPELAASAPCCGTAAPAPQLAPATGGCCR